MPIEGDLNCLARQPKFTHPTNDMSGSALLNSSFASVAYSHRPGFSYIAASLVGLQQLGARLEDFRLQTAQTEA